MFMQCEWKRPYYCHVAKSGLCSHNLSFCMHINDYNVSVFPLFGELYEVIVCNGTVWQRMVLFYCNHEGRNVYGTNQCK